MYEYSIVIHKMNEKKIWQDLQNEMAEKYRKYNIKRKKTVVLYTMYLYIGR